MHGWVPNQVDRLRLTNISSIITLLVNDILVIYVQSTFLPNLNEWGWVIVVDHLGN